MANIQEIVEPLKQKSIDAAVAYMKNRIDHCLNILEAADWDINAVAPRATYSMGDEEHRAASAKRNFFERITKRDHNRFITSGVDTVFKNETGADRVFSEVAVMAGESFDSYVAKLNLKVGEHDDATMELVNGLWTESLIKITKGDKVEKWKTKVITNFSKHGLAFNQWPTRMVK